MVLSLQIVTKDYSPTGDVAKTFEVAVDGKTLPVNEPVADELFTIPVSRAALAKDLDRGTEVPLVEQFEAGDEMVPDVSAEEQKESVEELPPPPPAGTETAQPPGLWGVLLVVLSLLILGAGGYLFLRNGLAGVLKSAASDSQSVPVGPTAEHRSAVRTRGEPETLADEDQPAGNQSPGGLVLTMGQGLGPVRFGMTKEEVVRLLGEPAQISPDGYSLVYRSRGFTIRCEPTIGVHGILCASNIAGGRETWGADFSGQTEKGIHIGSTEVEIVAAYGEPDRVEVTSRGHQRNLLYPGLRARFIIVRNRLVHIDAGPPSGP